MADDLGALPPGLARNPGPSTRDKILADNQAVPEALVAQSYEFIGDADVPYDRYTSQEFFQKEMDKIWSKVWQWACRVEAIPEVGDYVVYDIGPYSIIVVRNSPDEVKAYHNSCLHRGTQFRRSETAGSATELKCPFHGWVWNLDGSLRTVPCRWDFPHVTDEAYKLPEVKVELWGGFVWINIDPDAEPLNNQLGALAEHFQGRWDLSRRYTVLHMQKELDTNWKNAMEAFLEAYHSMETHAGGKAASGGWDNAVYDIFDQHLTRFVHTVASTYPDSPNNEPFSLPAPNDQQIYEGMRRRRIGPDAPPLPEGRTARSFTAEQLRERWTKEWGVDLSQHTDSEMLDSIEYHFFPNMCLFPGVSLPMIYRFRPIGMEPGRAVFDLLFLRPLPEGAEAPPAPDPVRVTHNESYASVPGMDPGLGNTYDQDTGNLEMQYRGFIASKKRGETLGNYQEARIRHFHQTIDKYMAR